jgi:hypothetical protein
MKSSVSFITFQTPVETQFYSKINTDCEVTVALLLQTCDPRHRLLFKSGIVFVFFRTYQ